MVTESSPLEGVKLEMVLKAHDQYLRRLVAHDISINAYRMLFGSRAGVERVVEMFFGQ